MQATRNFLSRFSGIIRLVIFIILVLVIIFFGIRFIRNRQASNRAEQAVQTAQSDTKEDTTRQPEKKAEEPKKSESESDKQSPVPSGINDNKQTTTAPPATIPETGSGLEYTVSVLMIAAIAYLLTLNMNLKTRLKQ